MLKIGTDNSSDVRGINSSQKSNSMRSGLTKEERVSENTRLGRISGQNHSHLKGSYSKKMLQRDNYVKS